MPFSVENDIALLASSLQSSGRSVVLFKTSLMFGSVGSFIALDVACRLRALFMRSVHKGMISVWLADMVDRWLTDATARPVATERVSADWVGGSHAPAVRKVVVRAFDHAGGPRSRQR